jgi:glycosyltransferase involved in cell wall biosynthesis
MKDDAILTVLMPCLNEAETLATCIRKAKQCIKEMGIEAEVLVADNGSTDGSKEIARKEGARVIEVPRKGYGNALRAGIEQAKGKWIIMADADDSYDFLCLQPFVDKLRAGYDLVMGCRLPSGGGTILDGAMPWKHRWLGNPVLTFIGRLFFNCPVNDFHCGLRGFRKEAAEEMSLVTGGMEFASEMVIKANLKQMRITEVPITLHPDGRSRPPHLRSWRDGWRHLRFMLLYCPRWLFLIPGFVLILFSLLVALGIMAFQLRFGPVVFDVNTLVYACGTFLVGFQMVLFAVLTKIFGVSQGLLPQDPRLETFFKFFTLETALVVGFLSVLAGFGGAAFALHLWGQTSFGQLDPREMLKIVAPSMTAMVFGSQVVLFGFFMSVLGLQTSNR